MKIAGAIKVKTMKKLILSVALVSVMSSSYAAPEILFNINSQRSVLDLATDPDLKPWESFTYLKDLCFKNAEAEEALDEIINFKDAELLFDFDTEWFVQAGVRGDYVDILAVNGKVMDDGYTEEEATYEYVIGECEF